MRLRELAGEVNRAKEVRIWFELDPDHEQGTMYVRIEKVAARDIIEHCRLHGLDDIEAKVENRILYIDSIEYEDEEEEPEDEEELEEEPQP